MSIGFHVTGEGGRTKKGCKETEEARRIEQEDVVVVGAVPSFFLSFSSARSVFVRNADRNRFPGFDVLFVNRRLRAKKRPNAR